MTMQELEAWLKEHPAPASSDEVLAMEPNTVEKAISGPHEQISPTAFVEMLKPDGDTALVPKANVPAYEAKGFVAGNEQEIPDLGAYWDEAAKTEAPKSEEPPAEAPAA